MSALYSFMRKGFPYALVFMLFACGGGGGSDGAPGGAGTNDIVAATVAQRGVPDNVFIAALNPAQEIPVNSSSASGIGVVLIDPATGLMRASLTTAGITATSVDIRLVGAGTFGLISLSLTEIPAGGGVWSAQATLTESQLAALRNGDYQFNVGSAAFPQGEIRGQIVPGLPASGISNTVDLMPDTNGVNSDSFTTGNTITTNPATSPVPGSTIGTTIGSGGLDPFDSVDTITPTSTIPLPGVAIQQTAFINMLTGTQQVPANSSLAVAVGVVIIDATGQSMVASITSIGISGLSAHIHQAAPGANGTAILALNETTSGSGIWAARLTLAEAQRSAFENGNYYFDIHTAAFPDGELRGQIVATGRTDTTGIVGTGSTGIIGTITPAGMTTTSFVSVTGTGITGSTPTDTTSGSVPSFGNPVGSGIGSASDLTDTGVATFGNPVGSGIGSASYITDTNVTTFGNPAEVSTGREVSTPFISTPASNPLETGVDMNTDSAGNFGTSSINSGSVVGFATVSF